MMPILPPCPRSSAPRRVALCLLLWFGTMAQGQAGATDGHPLRYIDTTSPRTTLQGFVETLNEGYELGYGRVRDYLNSPRLFLSREDLGSIRSAFSRLNNAERAIDFSRLPTATYRESSRRLTLQLKDILDHLVLPAWSSVPDATLMAGLEFKRWEIPGTEIRIVRQETGPRAGEYLFSSDTVERIPDMFEQARDLPYQPGALLGLYEFSTNGPAGVALALSQVIPPRWLLNLPDWAMLRLLGQPLWRWLGSVGVLAAGFGVVALCFRAHRGRGFRGEWLRPLGMVLVTPVTALIVGDILRVTGPIGQMLTLTLWSLFYLALTWLVWSVGTAIADNVIRQENLLASSIDSQLVRLVLRLLTIALAIAVLVMGGDRVGLPAYSVVAGLGVGGLAVALAGQQTLANLLGSLIIMFEKPFGIGDNVKVGSIEGEVESVGFRSTRIRTHHGSLVSIPSSQMVNSTIDNLQAREQRELKTLLSLTYDTPIPLIGRFIEAVETQLRSHPDIRQDNLQVFLHDLGPHSLDVWVRFMIRTTDRLTELRERQRILFDILRLAEGLGVRFAFPTQSLHIEDWPVERRGVMETPAPPGERRVPPG